MKKLLLIALLIVSVAVIGTAAAKVTIQFWLYGGAPENIKINHDWVAKFNQQYTNIQVVITDQDWNTIFQHFQTAAMSNSLPDVARIQAPMINAFGAKGGYIEPLDNFPDFASVKNLYVDGYINALKYAGHYWGLPDTPILFPVVSNPAVFKAAGVAKPNDSTWTFNDWRAISKKLTLKDSSGKVVQYGYAMMGGDLGGTAYRAAPLVFMEGGQAFNDDMSQSLFNTQPWRDVMQMEVDMNQVDKSIEPGYLTDTSGDLWNKWAAGTVAMDIEWPGFPAVIRSQHPGVDVWVEQIPKAPKVTGAGTPGTLSDGSAISIMKSSTHKNEAWTFIKFKTGPDYDVVNTTPAGGGMPVCKATYALPAWKQYEGYDAYTAMGPNSRPWPYHPALPEITRDVYATDLLKAIKGDMTVDAAINDIQSKVTAILARK
jgi:ABC-type glycerol-3-phosphate transport system substrate-binding protein